MGKSIGWIAALGCLVFFLGCAQQVKEVKEGFKEGWGDVKKTFSGKEEKPAKDTKAGEAKTKPKESPPPETAPDTEKKPAAGPKPEGIFGPK